MMRTINLQDYLNKSAFAPLNDSDNIYSSTYSAMTIHQKMNGFILNKSDPFAGQAIIKPMLLESRKQIIETNLPHIYSLMGDPDFVDKMDEVRDLLKTEIIELACTDSYIDLITEVGMLKYLFKAAETE